MWKTELLSLLLYILVTMDHSNGSGNDTDDITRLSMMLFEDYDPGIFSKCDSTNATNVRMDLALRQVLDMDEPQQILRINAWIRMRWNDCRLTWDPADFGNITHIIIPYDRIWTPDIALYDSVSDEFVGLKDYRPKIRFNGIIRYNFPTIIESLCSLDVTKFPYDTQTCKLKFGSWSYHGLDLDIFYDHPYADLSSAQENVEWNILSFNAERNVIFYGCCPEPYPDITYYLTLKRKPTFYVNNIVIPSFLITAIAVLGFVLPVESGEKVSLQMTVLLSLAVFQLLVADSLPPSDKAPLIGTYFNFSLFLVGFACAAAVAVLVISFQGTRRKIPDRIRYIFLQRLSKVLCLWSLEFDPYKGENYKQTSNEKPESKKPTNGNTFPMSKVEGEKNTEEVTGDFDVVRTSDQEEPNISVEKEWEMFAIVVDKITCCIFVFTLIVGAIVIFSQFQ